MFLKINSGMNRLGFAPQRFRAAWTRLDALPQVDEISLMTHFSDADGARASRSRSRVFDAVTRDLPGERSLANSAASLRHRRRPGGARRLDPARHRASTAARPTSPSTTSRTGTCSPA